MSFDIPSLSELLERSKADVQAELKESNPFLPNSAILALITAYAGRIDGAYQQVNILQTQLFPSTATGVYLQMWGAWRGIYPNVPSQALGSITVNGVPGSLIPINTLFSVSSGEQYETLANASVITLSEDVVTLTRSGSVVTAVTSAPHNLATGVVVTITGALQTEYNVTAAINVTGLSSFTYTITTTPITPASGMISVNATVGILSIRSIDSGSDTNLTAGTQVTLVIPLLGVENNGYVQFDGVTGGTDVEDEESFRLRVIDAWQNPNTPFNPTNIRRYAQTVPGVTRVFIFPTTPELGQVTVFFVRDNDANIIPSTADVANVKNTLLEIEPVTTTPDNLIVQAPTPITIDFTFTSITPNTASMQTAITNNLQAFFSESVSVGVDISQNAYTCAIFNTIDPSTGATLTDFTLAAPLGGINITFGELGLLGTVSFI